MLKNIDAVLFDVDGTLLDTTEFIIQAFEHSLKVHGHTVPDRQTIAKVVGLPLLECYMKLTDLDEVAHLGKEHHNFQRGNMHLSKAFTNTKPTLEALRKKGKKIAAVTNRKRDFVIDTLELAEIHNLFDFIVGAEDVKIMKPDPEGIFKALNYLNIKPDNAVMVGDTEHDVNAGRGAGTFTIGVTYGFTTEGVTNSKPDYLVNDIKDILTIIS